METEAGFEGGHLAWDQYLRKEVSNRFATFNCTPPGIYHIDIVFRIRKDGCIDCMMAVSRNGYGLEEAVMHAIGQSPRWMPATRNGRIVIGYKRQSHTINIPHAL